MKYMRWDRLDSLVVLAWLSFAWASARAPSLGPPVKYIRAFDVVLVLAWATFAWLSYSRRKAMLRERAFAALAGPRPPSESTVIRRGSRGPAVLAWKDRLREVGYVLPPGDVFDAETEAATAAYQDTLGLVADGIAGPRTLRKLPRRLPWRRRRR